MYTYIHTCTFFFLNTQKKLHIILFKIEEFNIKDTRVLHTRLLEG
jgi:hypothetical protein